jgi:putative transposase
MGEENNRVQKGNHCAWEIHYHIVFPVKYRKALLDQDVVEIIRATVIEIQERYEIEFESMGMDKNHIHILCNAHPKIAPGKIVQIFKSITAREIFRQKPEIKKELWGGEFWTDGYSVGTIGSHGNWEVVEKYVTNQGQAKEEVKQLRLF